MSYSRWTPEGMPWYAWGGGEVDGPLVLAIWHHDEDEAVHITSAEAEVIMRGDVELQSLFTTALTPLELQKAAEILVEYLEDVAEEAGERVGRA